MVEFLILMSCVSVGSRYNYMCSKTIEAALIETEITQTIQLAQKYYEKRAEKILSKEVMIALIFGANVVSRREITLGFTFKPISDTIVLQGRSSGGTIQLGWAF